MLSVFLVFLFLAAHGIAQFGPTAWTVTPFNPPALPFAVKSPYVNTWSPLGNASEAVTSAWPRTWHKGFDIVAWYSAIRVDGKAYQVLGQAPTPQLPIASQQQVVYTPTQVSYIIAAGGVDVNMTFLSPLEPTDLVRQSMPFAYMYITLQPNDGKAHDVQLYTDVSGEWIAGDRGLPTNWTINESSNFVYLQMQPSSPLPFQELNIRPQDGILYYCTKKSDNVTWQIANSADLRNSFGNGSVTSLPKTAEANFHPLGIPDYDTMGIAVDLGTVNSISETLVYALGVVRDPVVQYANQKVQIEKRSSYYWSKFTNVHDVIEDVLDNFDNAVTASTTIDNKILRDASQISSNYGDILRLSTLPAMGALEYTVLKDSSGTFNTSDIKAFLSDLGGIGSGGVSAVDVLYAAMPAYLYLNPAILGYLLSPLMEYQESTQYTNPYAAQDLGSQFPNATGNSNGHDQGIEHSANMLIISLAHAQTSGDGSLLNQHYNLLSSWGNYLVNNTMNPEDQASSLSDAILSSNQTNLMLKGIIGIGAMAKISGYMGYTDVQSRFQGIAQQYMQKWTSLAVDSGRLRISFGSTSSGMIYNLYADKLLQLKLVPSSVYDTQTQYYKSQTSLFKYGIPLDASNASSTARADWMMFASAAATDTTVRDAMIEQIRSYLSAELQNRPFPILYNPRDGTQLDGENSPAVGAAFAHLALTLPIQSVSASGIFDGSGGGSNPGAIAGAAVGGVAGLALIVGAGIFFYRRRQRQQQLNNMEKGTDRILRAKSANLTADPVLKPLSGTLHPDMSDTRTNPYSRVNNSSASFVRVRGTSNASTGPFHVANLSDRDFAMTPGMTSDSSAIGGSITGIATMGSNSTPRTPTRRTKDAAHQEELRTEVDNLRRELERIREDRVVLPSPSIPPPAYDEDPTHALPNPYTR